MLADEVGYGKTAISLGLIDCAADDVKRDFKKTKYPACYIATKATLIIVPPHLTRQWEGEIRKFTKSRFEVVTLTPRATSTPSRSETSSMQIL